MNREDFPIINEDIVYLDNCATTYKPQVVIDKINEYYTKYTSNAHRGDYDSSLRVDKEYESVRTKIKDFIGCKRDEEIVFTSGTTMGLNMIIFGYCKNILSAGDEILISKAEHASNVLPWMTLVKDLGIVVKYIPLNEDYSVTLENVKNSITDKTKVISLAHISNVIGDIRPLKEIGKLARENNILFIVDSAQGLGHEKINVEECNIDFLAASAHKMCGPTGTGFLYGKYELLEKMEPVFYGGGMNSFFESNCDFELKSVPWKFEAGTQNIAGVIGMGAAIDYINSIGLDNIHKHDLELKRYAVEKLEKIPNIIIYNKNVDGGIVAFNIDKIFSQDTAIFLNRFGICVRSGNHCAKILKDEIGVTNTCRASFYLYNTKDDIDKFASALERQAEVYDNII